MVVFVVGWVFRDLCFDYCFFIVGLVLLLIDGLFGGVCVLYSVVMVIVVLVVVMLVTIG